MSKSHGSYTETFSVAIYLLLIYDNYSISPQSLATIYPLGPNRDLCVTISSVRP